MFKWWEYAVATFAVLFIVAFATPIYASSVSFVEAPQLKVVSQNSLETFIVYSFDEINSSTWNVSWAWVSPAHQAAAITNFTYYRAVDPPNTTNVSFYGINVTAEEFKELNATVVVNLTSGIVASTDNVNLTKDSGSFEVYFPNGFAAGKQVKFGFNSVIIQSSGAGDATLAGNSPKLIKTTLGGNAAHAVYMVNNSEIFYAQSFDDGVTWVNQTELTTGTGFGSVWSASVVNDGNDNLNIVFIDSSNSTVYYVNGSRSGLGWSFTTPLNVTAASFYPNDGYGALGLTLGANNSVWLAYASYSTNQLCVKVCRSNCGTASNWNATNSSSTETCASDAANIGAGSLASNSTGSTFIAFRNTAQYLMVCAFNPTGNGLWSYSDFTGRSCLTFFSDLNSWISGAPVYDIYPSIVVNSSGALFLAYENQSNQTVFGYCPNHCEEGASNFHAFNSSASGLGIISNSTGFNPTSPSKQVNVGLNGGLPIVTWRENIGGGSNDGVFYILAVSSSVWGNVTQLTNGSTRVSNPIVFRSNVFGSQGILWLSNTSTVGLNQIVFQSVSTPSNSVSISSPLNATYVDSTSISVVYLFLSNVNSQANCSHYVDSALQDSTILANNTNYTGSLLGLGIGSHSLNATCFNSTWSASSIVFFSVYSYAVTETNVLQAYEAASNPFTVNVSVNPGVYKNVNAVLTWNNTVYVASKTNTSTWFYFNASVASELLDVNATNASFYWTINLTYANNSVFSFNSTELNQTLLFGTFFVSISASPNPALSGESVTITSNISSFSASYSSVTHYVNSTATTAPLYLGGVWYSVTTAPVVIDSGVMEINGSLNVSFNGSSKIRYSSDINVSVFTLNITQCNSGNVILNFTVQDSTNFTVLLMNHEATLVFYVSNISANLTLNASAVNVSFFSFCLNTNIASLKVRSFHLYRNLPEYPQKAFFLLDLNLTNGTVSNITLYADNYSSAFLTSVKLYDANGVVLKQKYVQILRYYPALNQYLLSGMVVTDNNGEASTYLIPNDIWFKFVVLNEDGSIVSTLPQQQVFCAAASCAVVLRTSSTVTGADFWSYNGKVLSYCNFDNASSNLTCYVDDTSSTLQHFVLTVQKVGYFATANWCEQHLYSSAGSLTCTLDNSTGEFSFSIRGYGSFVPILSGYLVPTANDLKYGSAGLLIALILFIVVSFAGLYSPSAAMALGTLSLIFSSWLGFYLVSASSLAALVIVVVIFILKLRQ